MKVHSPQGFKGKRIHLEGRVSLFQGKQALAVPDDVRIGEGGVDARNGGIALHRIEGGKKRLPRSVFELPLLRPYPAIQVGTASVLDVKRVDHAVPGEPMMHATGGKLGIGAIAVKGAPELHRNFAMDNTVGSRALHTDGRVVPPQVRVLRHRCGHGDSSQASVTYP